MLENVTELTEKESVTNISFDIIKTLKNISPKKSYKISNIFNYQYQLKNFIETITEILKKNEYDFTYNIYQNYVDFYDFVFPSPKNDTIEFMFSELLPTSGNKLLILESLDHYQVNVKQLFQHLISSDQFMSYKLPPNCFILIFENFETITR